MKKEKSKKQPDIVNEMFGHLINMMGEEGAGFMIALLCDCLDKLVQGVPGRRVRSLELKLNDYFAVKYDFEKEEYVDD